MLFFPFTLSTTNNVVLLMVIIILYPLLDTVHAGSYCEILANVISDTKTPFKLNIELPDGQQTEEMLFEEPGQRNVILKGNNCGSNFWLLNTFRRDEKGEWQLAKESKAKLDGAGGQMTLKVEDVLQPRVAARFGVSCSESLICGGGPLSGNAGGNNHLSLLG